jgi:copper transport protein
VRPLALILALLIALAHASDAGAHASLVRADPADGAVLPLPPAGLTLTFNEPVSPLLMRLIGPDGKAITLRDVVSENATVTISAPPMPERGTHVLSWRVISADGHPVGGAVMFSIGAPSARPDDAADRQTDASVRTLLWAMKLILYVGLFVGVGGAFFQAWIAESRSRAARSMIAAILAALIAAPMSIGLQGLDALALPVSGLGQKIVWETGTATAYGCTAVVAAFALFAGLLSLAAEPRRIARGLALIGLLGIGLALSLSGHAGTAEPWLISRLAVFVHAVCVAFWIGALLPLLVDLRRTAEANQGSVFKEFACFSRAILIPLALLVASGAWLAVVQLGRVDALWTTSYGQVLACKLAAVAVLLGLAAANRYRLVPKLEGGGDAAVRPLAISITLEFTIAIVILGLVALWRFTPPPRALAINAPISLHLHGDKAMAQIDIERRDRGRALANVLVLDGAFQPLAVKEVALVFANPGAGIEPFRRTATRAAESTSPDAPATMWRIDDLRIPVAGRWDLRVELLISDFDKLMVEDTVTLPRLP